ncbi:MAG: hypothetical protein ACYTEW_23245, partial [Planctomycetota bacterium]
MFIHPWGEITLGRGSTAVKISGDDPTYRIWGGALLPEAEYDNTPGDFLGEFGLRADGTIIVNADSGNFVLDSQIPSFLMGDATDYFTGIGMWFGDDGGTYKFHLGDPAGDYISWDGVNLVISSGVAVDHGGLLGLGDDDHPQYAAIAQDETITGNWIFDPSAGTTVFNYAADAEARIDIKSQENDVDGAIGGIHFFGYDGNPASVEYASFTAHILDPTLDAYYGYMRWNLAYDGFNPVRVMQLQGGADARTDLQFYTDVETTGQEMGMLRWRGLNSVQAETYYARQFIVGENTVNGAEEGGIHFAVAKAGVMTNVARVLSSGLEVYNPSDPDDFIALVAPATGLTQYLQFVYEDLQVAAITVDTAGDMIVSGNSIILPILTTDWDAGSNEIRAETFESDIATGTAPLVVAS